MMIEMVRDIKAQAGAALSKKTDDKSGERLKYLPCILASAKEK